MRAKLIVALAALLVVPVAGAESIAQEADAVARAVAVQVVVPESDTSAYGYATAPPRSGAPSVPFTYPADGSIVSIGAVAAAAGATPSKGIARAASEAVQISLFGGEITADRIKAAVRGSRDTGDLADSGISNLVVLGQPVAAGPNLRLPLGDWGYALVLVQSVAEGTDEQPSFTGSFTGLVVHLDADHGGLRAGSEIRIGFAEASVRGKVAEKPTETQAAPTKQNAAPTTRAPKRQTPARPATRQPDNGVETVKKRKQRKGARILAPPDVRPKLTASRYVFPVYGPSAYTNTWMAPRAGISGGWHHGEDIFAPLGAPVLAVADGTVFSVGWNDIGGYRFWLRDSQGNEFYYAHLSAFTTLAVDGARVKAGDVIGFVGNSGDAEGTPYHLHFEIHPVGLLFLGYDGAINPNPYLDAWKRIEDVRIRPAVGWAPPVAPTSQAPTPGAILLESSDISTASGLEPGALRRALRAQLHVGEGGLGVLPVPIPVLDRS